MPRRTDRSRIVLWVQENIEDELTAFYVQPTRYGLMYLVDSVVDLVEEVKLQSKYRITDESIAAVYTEVAYTLCDALRPVDMSVCVDVITETFMRREMGERINWRKVFIDATRRFRPPE